MMFFNEESLMFSIPDEWWESAFKFQNEHPKEWKEICKQAQERTKEFGDCGAKIGNSLSKHIDESLLHLIKEE